MIDGLLYGLLGGLLNGGSGYMKGTSNESFDWMKFIRTLLVSGGSGAMVAGFGIDQAAALTIASMGADNLIENVAKALYRRLKK